MSDEIQTIHTNCPIDGHEEITRIVAEFFVINPEEEYVLLETGGEEYSFEIYHPKTVHAINILLQEAHFGGTLESSTL